MRAPSSISCKSLCADYIGLLLTWRGFAEKISYFGKSPTESRFESFAKCSMSFKIKACEDFNHRNTLSISRIRIRTQRRDWAKGGVLQRSRFIRSVAMSYSQMCQNLALLSRSCFLSLTVIAPMKKSHVHFLQGSEKTALPDLLENWKGEEL